MKGFSILLTVLLFVAAVELANLLKQAGALPADKAALTDSERAPTNDFAWYARYQSLRSPSPVIR